MAGRRQQVRRTADRYRREGDEVFINPPPEQVPAGLEWLRGDLFAHRGEEQVLVIVQGDVAQFLLRCRFFEATVQRERRDDNTGRS